MSLGIGKYLLYCEGLAFGAAFADLGDRLFLADGWRVGDGGHRFAWVLIYIR